MDTAQQKHPDLLLATEFQKLTSVGQFDHRGLRPLELGVKPGFQLLHGQIRGVALVKVREWQAEFGAELFQGHFLFAGADQDEIRSLEDGGQIIHQGTRPVEYDVANHAGKLTFDRSSRKLKNPDCVRATGGVFNKECSNSRPETNSNDQRCAQTSP
jgi:hypothetical protein